MQWMEQVIPGETQLPLRDDYHIAHALVLDNR